MKITQSITCLICAAALLLAYSFRPVETRNAQQPRAAQQDNRAQRGTAAPTPDADWQEAATRMREFCPNRIDFIINRLQNKPAEQEQAKRRMIDLYRQLKNIPRNDVELQKAMAFQTQADDLQFGAILKYRDARQANNAAQQLVADRDLKAAAEALVNAEIRVKLARIQRLQAEVNDLEGRRQVLVNQRYNQGLNLAKNTAALSGGKVTGDAVVDPDKKK